MTKKERRFVTVIFILTALEFVGAVYRTVTGGPAEFSNNLLIALQCAIMAAAVFVPLFVRRVFRVRIPGTMYVLFVVFSFCGLILGDARNFFDRFEHWDSLLHFSSGVLLAILGFLLVNTLNNSERMNIRLNPFFVAAVAFCFVMTMQAMWEIFEFLSDDWLGTNAQTFMATTTGSYIGPGDVPLMGHEALRDTMNDFMLDGLGGLIVSVIGYFDLKRGKKSLASERLEAVEEKRLDGDDEQG